MDMHIPAAAPAERIAVIGAGIVGTCIAHTLRKRGAEVVLLDRNPPGSGCSFGNLGAISTSSVAPLAMPSVLRSLPAMLLDPGSPLILRPAYLPRAAPWLARFLLSTRRGRVEASSDALARLHTGAIEAHVALAAEVGVPELVVRRGQLHLYGSSAAYDKDAAAWQLRAAHGLPFEQLDAGDIEALEPHVGRRYPLGLYLPGDATVLNPLRYVQAIAADFLARGGQFRQAEVRRLAQTGPRQWRLGLDDGHEPTFSQVVVAAGAWAPRLLEPIGIRLPLESQRGYHVQFEGGAGLVSRSVVLVDKKAFLAPMETGLRIGGTVEIAGLERPADPRRSMLLEQVARNTFPALEGVGCAHWMGHRPCMPDSVPVIGESDRPGLHLAVGHGHLGLTDSVATARRIGDAVHARATAHAAI